MAVPIYYNIKNVAVRWPTSIITALTIGLAIFMLIVSFAILEGLENAKAKTGNPDNILILQRGATRINQSFIKKEHYNILANMPGVQKKESLSLIAPEIVTLMHTPRSLESATQAFIRLRGVNFPVAKAQKNITIIKGKKFKPGLNEIMVGKYLAEKFPSLDIGGKIKIGTISWTITGHFDAEGPSYNIEIWGDVEQIFANSKMKKYSAISATLKDPGTFPGIKAKLESVKQLNVSAVREQEYYHKQIEETINNFSWLGLIIITLMSIGAFFTTINTIYGMVEGRIKETAVLRVIGYSKLSIYICFIIESCFITLLGGLLGLIAAFPLNHLPVIKWQALSEISYNISITPKVIIVAIIVSIILGIISGLFPAWKASRLRMSEVLKK